jgi:5-methylcytosine-specific restriction endonuclease McrA
MSERSEHEHAEHAERPGGAIGRQGRERDALPRRKVQFLKRRQNYRCAHCKHTLPVTAQIDHIVPWCISHDDRIINLQALCPNCHALKTRREARRIYRYRRARRALDLPSERLCWFCGRVWSAHFAGCPNCNA